MYRVSIGKMRKLKYRISIDRDIGITIYTKVLVTLICKCYSTAFLGNKYTIIHYHANSHKHRNKYFISGGGIIRHDH